MTVGQDGSADLGMLEEPDDPGRRRRAGNPVPRYSMSPPTRQDAVPEHSQTYAWRYFRRNRYLGTLACDSTRPRSDGRRSDLQVGFDPLEVVTGQGQVGLLAVEHQVQEQVVRSVVLREQADQVVLGTEGDEDVLDLVVEPERLDRAHLGPDHLGVARRGEVEVEVLTAAHGAEGHAAVPVDQRDAGGALDRHRFLERRFDVHAYFPSYRLAAPAPDLRGERSHLRPISAVKPICWAKYVTVQFVVLQDSWFGGG